jgi:hypothetical protein
MKRINCRQCIHYYVTWDKSFPYGCRAMRFKSKMTPSAEVHINSGKPCLLFSIKKSGANKKKQPISSGAGHIRQYE